MFFSLFLMFGVLLLSTIFNFCLTDENENKGFLLFCVMFLCHSSLNWLLFKSCSNLLIAVVIYYHIASSFLPSFLYLLTSLITYLIVLQFTLLQVLQLTVLQVLQFKKIAEFC